MPYHVTLKLTELEAETIVEAVTDGLSEIGGEKQKAFERSMYKFAIALQRTKKRREIDASKRALQ